MGETVSREVPTDAYAELGTFERAHLLERLSLLYLGPASMRPFAEGERPQDEAAAYRMALTADARLSAYGYRLDERSLAELARRYAAGTFCDPMGAVAELRPTPDAQPMYPDFPTQVMSMDEATYRLHQALHYLSTYGVESLAAGLGIPLEVSQGWLPRVEATEKTEGDGALLDARALSLVFSLEEAAEAVWQHLVYRNERMTDSDVRLASALPIPKDAEGSKIVFHENALMLLDQALVSTKDLPVDCFVQRAQHFAAHPGDVVKFIIYLRGRIPRDKHFPTSWRRRLVALLESYGVPSLEENLTLNRERSLRALEFVSYNRFSRSAEHRAVVDALRDGTLRSWASRKEEVYRSGDAGAIVRMLSERPGIMLREVVRMLRVGVPGRQIEAAFDGTKLSLATLLNVTARLGAPYTAPVHAQQVEGGSAKVPDVAKEQLLRAQAQQLVHGLLYTRLCELETPLRGKRIMLDSQGYDLAHSYVLTNVATGTSSYFAPGMAMGIPEAARRVRLFAFWDDSTKRVDLDLHGTTDTGAHVGWDGAFSQSGLTMSGDVTHSKNAAEYLDVDLAKAAATGVAYVRLTLHYYNGGTFNDIATAFTGLLVVDKVKPNYRLYQSENVLMRNDLSEVRQTIMSLCLVDVAHRCVVALMGGEVPYGSSYSAQSVLDDLLSAQGATLDASEEELGEDGLKVCVGKAAKGEISLMDHGWFMLE